MRLTKCVNNCINVNKTRRNCPFDLKIGMRIHCITYLITIPIFLQILTYSSLNIYEVDKCVNNCINANKTRRNCLFDLKIGMGIPCIVYFKIVFFFIQILTYSSLNIYEDDKCVNNFINANKTRRHCLFDLKIGMKIPCIMYFILRWAFFCKY